MPINYLDRNQEDIYAINRLGSTFSDALIGLQLNKEHAQDTAVRQAMDRAYLELARRKQDVEEWKAPLENQRLQADARRMGNEADMYSKHSSLYQAQIDAAKGKELRASRDFATQGAIGDMTSDLYDTDPEKNPMVYQTLRGLIAGNTAKLVPQDYTTANQMNLLSASANPNVGNLAATRTPMYKEVPRGATLMDLANKRPIFNNPQIALQKSAEQQQLDRLKAYGSIYHDLGFDARKPFGQKVQKMMEGELDSMHGAIPHYPDEETARAAGHKGGSVVYLDDIGAKVQLHPQDGEEDGETELVGEEQE
jgi:hypothetical protein